MAHTVSVTAVTDRHRRPASRLLELRAPSELGLFLAAAPLLHAAPRGPSRRVMILPGFVASDVSTAPLRILLGRLGHEPTGWRLGRNLGPTDEILDGMVHRLEEEADIAGAAIPLIGWSLGGIYARVLGKENPDLVDQVITLGSPFNIGVDERTSVSGIWNSMSRRREFVRDRASLDVDSIPMPSTSVYTRTDGIVAWQSCVQTETARSENIEVYGSHIGLGVNVAVAYLIADRLTRTKSDWVHFDPPTALRPLFPRR